MQLRKKGVLFRLKRFRIILPFIFKGLMMDVNCVIADPQL